MHSVVLGDATENDVLRMLIENRLNQRHSSGGETKLAE